MEDEKLLAPGERFVPPIVPVYKPPAPPTPPPPNLPGMPSPSQQSWGVVISIIIIVLMIIIGAFYAWGKRIAQENALLTPQTTE